MIIRANASGRQEAAAAKHATNVNMRKLWPTVKCCNPIRTISKERDAPFRGARSHSRAN